MPYKFSEQPSKAASIFHEVKFIHVVWGRYFKARLLLYRLPSPKQNRNTNLQKLKTQPIKRLG